MNYFNPSKYKNIFFDLDNTLWDFKKNSEETLYELFNSYCPNRINELQQFLSIYYPINDKLWKRYRNGEINKQELREQRFTETFEKMNICNINGVQFETDYITLCPKKTNLFPYSIEILNYLKNKGYKLFLLTNGFKDIQIVKITESNLNGFFNKMITSEESGYKKPHRKMFEYALKSTNSKKSESIMIGDDLEADIIGSKKFGMDCIFFNSQNTIHNENITYEINSLKQITNIL